MIKFVLAALWASIVTLGAVLYSYQYARDDGDTVAAPPFFGGLDYVRTGVISVPVVREGAVNGYFLARLVYTVEPDKVKRLSVPADMLLVDQVHTYLYANPQIDFSDRSAFDLNAFRANLRDSINERVGEQLVHDVIVEQIDYLSKAEIRDHARRRAASSAQEG
ncbi:hypothetical protein NYR54_03135 [Chelativorans sp. SCAU2101]|uniref:Uncharacterized protein n=1 Tax=Chelativorans petroleitrophicus TaxID=2975484 RepID=A0A9X2X7Q0_9HYPH|nr:hypothetical protein [Chelativorans petroleitrophicus]MCT8989297.1 hypothetical protein [Chelativorans petroleitrophicus]